MRPTIERTLWFAAPFVTLGLLWEAFARLGPLPPILFPGLSKIGGALVHLGQSGILLHHVWGTLLRLLVGFVLGSAVALVVGMLMGRYQAVEDGLLPLVSIGAPIPGLAYAPLFILWFGLGDVSAVLLVAFATMFPVITNTWTGVKTVKTIWLRAALAMGINDRQLFRKVILPGALAYTLTGLRLGLARAWRVLVAAEMLTAVPAGLGWLIFGARELLNTDVMLAGIAVIGVVGLLLERLVFEPIERATVVRWGMLKA